MPAGEITFADKKTIGLVLGFKVSGLGLRVLGFRVSGLGVLGLRV